jgi:hypothetical protein
MIVEKLHNENLRRDLNEFSRVVSVRAACSNALRIWLRLGGG